MENVYIPSKSKPVLQSLHGPIFDILILILFFPIMDISSDFSHFVTRREYVFVALFYMVPVCKLHAIVMFDLRPTAKGHSNNEPSSEHASYAHLLRKLE